MATEQGRGPIFNPDYGKPLTQLDQLLDPALTAELYAVQDGVSVRTTLADLLALPLFRNAYLYTSRADAVAGVPFLLPTVQAVFVVEEGRLVVRDRASTAEDPLFPSGWGVTYRSISQEDVTLIVGLVQEAIDAAQAAQEAAALVGSYAPYASRSAAEAAVVDPQISRITVLTADGSLSYIADTTGTALTTADGRTWSPDGDATFAHWNVQKGVGQAAQIKAIAQWCADRKRKLKGDAGPYYLEADVDVRTTGEIIWDFDGTVFWDIRPTALANNSAFLIAPIFRSSYTVTAKIFTGTREVTVSNSAGLQVGDLFMIQSTLLINTDHRGNARVGQQAKIETINGNVLTLVDPAEMDYDVWTYDGSIVAAGTSSVTLPSNINRSTDTMRVRMVMTSGTLNGQSRNITGWNNTTKIATFGASSSSPWPAGMANGDTFRLECIVTGLPCTSTKATITGRSWVMRDKTIDAAPGATGFKGFTAAYIDDLHLSGMDIINMSETCLELRGCYKGLFTDMYLAGANKSFNGSSPSDGTGYGVAENQTYRMKGQNIRTFECRRGMDTGGSQASSWHFWLDNCDVIGGGVAYTGEAFFPNGPRYNSGMGSHGNAHYMRMTNCRMTDVMNPINLRGRRNEVLECSAIGFCQQPILMSSIDGAIIRGFRYDAGTSAADVRNSFVALTSADATKIPPAIIDILTDDINPNGEIIIENLSANPCFGPIVRLSRSGITPPIYLDGVKAHVSSVTNSASRFFLVDMLDGSGTPTISDLHIVSPPIITGRDGPDVISSGATVTTGLVNTAIPVSGTVYRKWDNTMNFVLANNTAKAIYIGTMDNPIEVSVFDNTGGASVFAQGVIMNARSQADASPNSATNKASIISLRNIELTGTSGTTGQVSLSYGGGNKPYFYVENRSGATKRLTLQLRQFGLVL